MKIAIDWSHTKGLVIYDGNKLKTEDRKSFIKRLISGYQADVLPLNWRKTIAHPIELRQRDRDGEESKGLLKSMNIIHSPSIILEEGCPLSLIYDLLRVGSQVFTISNRATQDYRVEHGIEKTDENDARIIWELANNGAKLKQVDFDDRDIQLHSLYNQYCRYQKARVAMQNMRKGYLRHFGDGESRTREQSNRILQPSSDTVPYDMAIDVLKGKEHSLLRELTPLVAGGESNRKLQSRLLIQPPAIKGLGDRIWAGLIVTANPANFKCLSGYLRFCGLTRDAIESHKYNRHARMLYHLLAEETMKLRDPTFRPVYDKCKADITEKHPDYSKLHIHNAALNRTATMLAKTIFECRDNAGGESRNQI